MKKWVMLSLLGLALGSQALYAGDKSGTQSFWERLRSKIESLVPQKRTTATNATGGVRGAAVSPEDIYWKGEAFSQEIAADELEEFKAAMRLAETSEMAQAQSAFSAFIKKYPESPLRKDAEQAAALIKP